MATETINDKYSEKNLLFYRAIPNYVIPENTNGYNVYSCKDCGDRFVLESSYQYHIQRKSVQISYKCRHCVRHMIFYNRCNFLSHIRSHTFKTATINVSDLKIDPLPLSFFKYLKKDDTSNALITDKTKSKSKNVCFECNKNITSVGPLYKDRAYHYMKYTCKVYSCPVCLFTLPTRCGLIAHLRIHLKSPPFFCPECGINLSHKSTIYPFNHSCEGFNMMRATTRLSCPKNCNYYHPNDFISHMKDKHLKRIFNCTECVVASFSESTMQKHLKTHEGTKMANLFYQCELCPGRLVMKSHVESHLNNHKQSSYVYPCWTCSMIFKNISDLFNHHVQNHGQNDELNKILASFNNDRSKKMYRVVKRCDHCMRNFTYKCHYEDINTLPNECPYKCTSNMIQNSKNDSSNKRGTENIKCPLCNEKISQNWENIKKHYALHHKEHQCVDPKVSLSKICIKKYLKGGKKKKEKLARRNIIKRSLKEINKTFRSGIKARNEGKPQQANQNPFNDFGLLADEKKNDEKIKSYICTKCQDKFETKEELEAHIVMEHRDPHMAYQCMECGECFVVKPSFSIHLRLHGISDIDNYINTKKCYNENALNKSVKNVTEEPLCENQCKICREQFHNTDDLEKHFRVHGMAFLMRNSLSKP